MRIVPVDASIIADHEGGNVLVGVMKVMDGLKHGTGLDLLCHIAIAPERMEIRERSDAWKRLPPFRLVRAGAAIRKVANGWTEGSLFQIRTLPCPVIGLTKHKEQGCRCQDGKSRNKVTFHDWNP